MHGDWIGPVTRKALSVFTVLTLTASLAAAPAIIIDHTCTDLSVIPDSAITSAAATTLVLRHASVGGNINDGLNDLQALDSDLDRSNWTFISRGNPGWAAKITDLVDYTAAHSTEYQVFTMKFCYIDEAASWTDYRDAMLTLESTYPSRTFIWWTMPIMTTGDSQRDAFNASCRAYCQANGKILFDIADIECHDPSGTPQTNGGYEALCAGYTSDGGHLNVDGRQQVARGWWHLIARVSGWDGTPVSAELTGFTSR